MVQGTESFTCHYFTQARGVAGSEDSMGILSFSCISAKLSVVGCSSAATSVLQHWQQSHSCPMNAAADSSNTQGCLGLVAS